MSDSFSDLDRRHMRRALDLARRGLGHVEPNPLVGAVLADGPRLLAQGFHAHFGGPHAEAAALAEAAESARGATLYVTLEPCAHFGKTPPCAPALIAAGGLDGHGIYYYVPALLKHFTTAQITALIAPRPHLSLAGELDPLTPPAGLDRIDRELRQVYTGLGAPQAWQMRRYASGHQETPAMRTEVMAFLEKWL